MLDQKFRRNSNKNFLKKKNELKKILPKLKPARKDADREYETAFPEIERDQEENADEMEMYESNLAADETMKTELEKIDAALPPMEKGTYGKCEIAKKKFLLSDFGLIHKQTLALIVRHNNK